MSMTSRYLDATNDLAFKKTFSDKNIMKDFLNGILRLSGGSAIEEIEFISPEEVPDLGQGKKSIFDLKCRDQDGNWFVVEMQNQRQSYFLKRVQFYASHTYVSQISKGSSHSGLMPVILVAISKENLFPDKVEYISYHRTREDKTKEQHLFEISYVFIELNKFNKKADELESIQDEWIYFLSTSEDLKKPPSTIKDEWVLKAYDTIERFNWTEAEYDAYIRARLLHEAEELTAQDNIDKARAEASAIGEAIGEARGEVKGVVKRNIEIAKKMLSKNKSIEEIMEFTELSAEEVERLKISYLLNTV